MSDQTHQGTSTDRFALDDVDSKFLQGSHLGFNVLLLLKVVKVFFLSLLLLLCVCVELSHQQ